MKHLTQEMSDFISRGTDSHIRVAVTGLSRAGKTAFITSLVNQLLHTSTYNAYRSLRRLEGRVIGAKASAAQHDDPALFLR